MEFLEKAPRWFILIAFSVVMAISVISVKFIVGNVFADVEKTKSTATVAKNLAETGAIAINDLKVSFAEMRGAQETFRKEYREDKKETDNKLEQILLAVKK